MWAYVLDAARLAMAVTLLVAGASKLARPEPLATSLGQVFGWPRPAGVWIARAVAVTELAAAFLLASAWALTLALTLTCLVGAGTAAFAITALRRGATAPCGCFGESSGRPVGVRNLLAGVGLVAGAGVLVLGGTDAAAAELMLPLTAATALMAVMVRDRARLLAPFRRHFTPPPPGPIPTGSEVS